MTCKPNAGENRYPYMSCRQLVVRTTVIYDVKEDQFRIFDTLKNNENYNEDV